MRCLMYSSISCTEDTQEVQVHPWRTSSKTKSKLSMSKQHTTRYSCTCNYFSKWEIAAVYNKTLKMKGQLDKHEHESKIVDIDQPRIKTQRALEWRPKHAIQFVTTLVTGVYDIHVGDSWKHSPNPWNCIHNSRYRYFETHSEEKALWNTCGCTSTDCGSCRNCRIWWSSVDFEGNNKSAFSESAQAWYYQVSLHRDNTFTNFHVNHPLHHISFKSRTDFPSTQSGRFKPAGC